MNSGMPTPAEGLHRKVMVDDTVCDSPRPQAESEGTITSSVAPEGGARVRSESRGVRGGRGSHLPTFDVVLGLAGGADPAVVGPVQLHLADVGAHTAGQRVVGDARQLDVVDVAVPVGTDVPGRLMVAARSDQRKEGLLTDTVFPDKKVHLKTLNFLKNPLVVFFFCGSRSSKICENV